MAGPQGLKDYKKTRDRQTAEVGGLNGAVMPNTLQPVQLTEVELGLGEGGLRTGEKDTAGMLDKSCQYSCGCMLPNTYIEQNSKVVIQG